MIDVIETVNQLFMTSMLGFVTKILSILFSNLLDKYINHSISNFIGLVINAVLDFWMMKRVFKVQESESIQFVFRYTISVIIAIIVAQVLYMSISTYTKKYHKKWYNNNWNKDIFWIRYVIGAFTYGFVEFPIHKFWVFKNGV